MRPTLAADQVRASLSQYLATTYALADESTRRALEGFLGDAEDGIFRGPYLRIRTPFRSAEGDDWQRHLTWWPRDFTPHRHQEARLGEAVHAARSGAAHPRHHRHRVREDRVVPDPAARPLPPRA